MDQPLHIGHYREFPFPLPRVLLNPPPWEKKLILICPSTNKITQSWALISYWQIFNFWIMDSHDITYLDAVYFPLCGLYTLHCYAAGMFTSRRMRKIYHCYKSNLKWGCKVKLLSYQPVTKINIGRIHMVLGTITHLRINRLRWVICLLEMDNLSKHKSKFLFLWFVCQHVLKTCWPMNQRSTSWSILGRPLIHISVNSQLRVD